MIIIVCKGLEALKEHFKNSKFPCETDHYLPVVFSPPRDGRSLTDPLPVASQGSISKQFQPVDDEMESNDGLGNRHDDCGGDSGDGGVKGPQDQEEIQ